ncbi:hypothetical protein Q7C36_021233 [Tachysurus vachellii]|uniref:Uncharacterized protein n=1 Tax=Tachysurus vachellii TaxID=175792 RepID=A0AA88LKB8_TACVA|nr:hypothetical protein Q7C36_021233 [Tachysurus vachellii]
MLDGVMERRDGGGIMQASGGGRPLSTASGLLGQIYGVNSSRTASFRFRTNSQKMLPITAPAFLPKADEPYMDQRRDLRLLESTSHPFSCASIRSGPL